MLDAEFKFRYNAAVRGARHGGKHGGEACVSAKDFQNEEAFMRACYSAQAVRQRNRARDTRAETNAVIRTRYVIVHRFRDSNGFNALLIETHCITQGIVAADWHQKI